MGWAGSVSRYEKRKKGHWDSGYRNLKCNASLHGKKRIAPRWTFVPVEFSIFKKLLSPPPRSIRHSQDTIVISMIWKKALKTAQLAFVPLCRSDIIKGTLLSVSSSHKDTVSKDGPVIKGQACASDVFDADSHTTCPTKMYGWRSPRQCEPLLFRLNSVPYPKGH